MIDYFAVLQRRLKAGPIRVTSDEPYVLEVPMSTPDFDQIAESIIDVHVRETWQQPGEEAGSRLATAIAEQLRLIWNTRGAADLATIAHDLSTMMGSTAAGPYVKNLTRTLQGLDR
jgi:hypothetical protein